jgi:hypothetical protein
MKSGLISFNGTRTKSLSGIPLCGIVIYLLFIISSLKKRMSISISLSPHLSEAILPVLFSISLM